MALEKNISAVVIGDLRENFPGSIERLVAQVKTQNKNLIATAPEGYRDEAAMLQISAAIHNLANGGVNFASLDEHNPNTIISMELDAMSRRVEIGHSAKSGALPPTGSPER